MGRDPAADKAASAQPRTPAPSVATGRGCSWEVSGTAERAQVDQRVRHQLHAIMPLLDAFKAEQQPLEFVLPRKGPLDAQA